ncbi:MAG: PaaI family thioesterase [Kiloniellales bacterium]
MSLREKLSSKRYQGAIEFIVEERSADRVVAKMPIRDGVLNPFGTVHAGAMIWLADVAATLCAIGDSEIDDKGRGFPLAVDLHAVLLGNQRQGVLTAEAQVVRRGGRVIVVRTEVTGDNGALLIDVTTTHVPAL